MTEITQADHDAAEEHFNVWYPDTAWGYDALVDTLARHREQAAAEERAKIVAWLRHKPDGTLEEQLLGYAIKRGEHETFTRSSDT